MRYHRPRLKMPPISYVSAKPGGGFVSHGTISPSVATAMQAVALAGGRLLRAQIKASRGGGTSRSEAVRKAWVTRRRGRAAR